MRAAAILLASLAVLAAGCSGQRDAGSTPDSCSGSTHGEPVGPPAGCPCPWQDGCGPPAVDPKVPIVLEVAGPVRSGEEVHVILRNVGNATWTYHDGGAEELGCPMEAWTPEGRMLWTSCGSDALRGRALHPGEAHSLPWRATECAQGSSGGFTAQCHEHRPLPPGDYSLRKEFRCDDPGSVPCAGLAGTVVTVVGS